MKRTTRRKGPAKRPDKYSSYPDLAAGETEGVDYRRDFIERPSPVLIAAPHGGTIEGGTSEIAAAIAGNDFSLYRFEGLIRTRPHRDLHIKSHLFNEPNALRLAAASDLVIGIHGREDGRDPETIWLGGRNHAVRDAVGKALRDAGFRVATTGHRLKGEHRRNICNRGRGGAGVQLEIPKTLRDELLANGELQARFAAATRGVTRPA